jgi:hypothetical protein
VSRLVIEALAKHNEIPDRATFHDASKMLEDRRVLLCIDNLETLLRDHPTTFDEFVSELPPRWRVLVTSRVSVNSAMVLPVDAMADGAARKLARDYLSRRGGTPLPESTIERLVHACDRNPLAIRLVVDSYLANVEPV